VDTGSIFVPIEGFDNYYVLMPAFSEKGLHFAKLLGAIGPFLKVIAGIVTLGV
jgi:hypothetical protein